MTKPKSWAECRQKLILSEGVEWDGEATEAQVPVPLTRRPILVAINNESNSILTIKLEHCIGEKMDGEDAVEVWAEIDIDGGFKISGNSARVFGPIASYPRFIGGRIRIMVEGEEPAPASQEITTIKILEI